MSAPRHSELCVAAWLCAALLAACDASAGDAAVDDAAALDAASLAPSQPPVAGLADAGLPMPSPSTSPLEIVARLPKPGDVAPFSLSQTGLYRSIATKELHEDATSFKPAFPLWSDGSDKLRWLILPKGAVIDNRDPAAWKFPVGSMAFKEFRVGEKRLETRLVARTGDGPDAFWMGSFVWNDGETDARFVPQGALNVRATQHDVPAVRSCETCHRGDAARFLGMSAVQAPALPAGVLSAPLSVPYVPPGSPAAAAALGYLHGNCAHCHNPSGSARPDTDLDLRLRATDRTVEGTLIYTSTLNVPLQYFGARAGERRLVPTDPTDSALLIRMRERGNETQMPPLGSEVVDPQGIVTVEAWIESF